MFSLSRCFPSVTFESESGFAGGSETKQGTDHANPGYPFGNLIWLCSWQKQENTSFPTPSSQLAELSILHFSFLFCSFSFISLSFPITQNSIAFSFEDVILHILIISFNSLFPRLTSFLLFFYCIPQNFVKVYNVIHFCIYLCSCSNLNAIIRYSATTHIRFHETRGSRFYLGRISVLISICR